MWPPPGPEGRRGRWCNAVAAQVPPGPDASLAGVIVQMALTPSLPGGRGGREGVWWWLPVSAPLPQFGGRGLRRALVSGGSDVKPRSPRPPVAASGDGAFPHSWCSCWDLALAAACGATGTSWSPCFLLRAPAGGAARERDLSACRMSEQPLPALLYFSATFGNLFLCHLERGLGNCGVAEPWAALSGGGVRGVPGSLRRMVPLGTPCPAGPASWLSGSVPRPQQGACCASRSSPGVPSPPSPQSCEQWRVLPLPAAPAPAWRPSGGGEGGVWPAGAGLDEGGEGPASLRCRGAPHCFPPEVVVRMRMTRNLHLPVFSASAGLELWCEWPNRGRALSQRCFNFVNGCKALGASRLRFSFFFSLTGTAGLISSPSAPKVYAWEWC